MNDFKQELVSFIRKIYDSSEFIPLHRPLFKGNEKKYLLDTIDSTFVSSVGEYVDEFERISQEISILVKSKLETQDIKKCFLRLTNQ